MDVADCPTCKSKAHIDWYEHPRRQTEHFVRCTNRDCPKAIGPVRYTDAEAIAAWDELAKQVQA